MPIDALPFLGEIASLATALCWAIAICIYRRLAEQTPAYVLNLIKNTIATGLCVATVFFLSSRPVSLKGPMMILALSGLIGIAVGDTASFAALRRVGALSPLRTKYLRVVKSRNWIQLPA